VVHATLEGAIYEALAELASDQNADVVIASLERDGSGGERGNGADSVDGVDRTAGS